MLIFRQCFGPDSDFLYQLLFFFNPRYVADFSALVETCRLLLEFVHDSGAFPWLTSHVFLIMFVLSMAYMIHYELGWNLIIVTCILLALFLWLSCIYRVTVLPYILSRLSSFLSKSLIKRLWMNGLSH